MVTLNMSPRTDDRSYVGGSWIADASGNEVAYSDYRAATAGSGVDG